MALRFDILMHPEHVLRIVFMLQCEQTLVFARAVSGADAIHSLVGLLAEVIHVDVASRVWLERLPQLPRPANVLFVFRAIGPAAYDQGVEGVLAVVERRVVLRYAADGATQLLYRDRRRERRHGSEAFNEDFDHFVTQVAQE